ncbi:MAG: hypothetical protein AAF624_08600 [Bacteroidota bacterium]
MDSGGGIDSEVVRVGSTVDDLARVLLYTLKGSLIAEHGREMVSHGLGYYSKAARAARIAWAHEQYGHTWNPDEIWMPMERERTSSKSDTSDENKPCDDDHFDVLVEAHRRNASLVTGRTVHPGFAYQREYLPDKGRVVVYPCRVIETDSGEALVRLGATTSKRQALRYIKRKRAQLAQRHSHAQQAEQTPQPGGGDE